MAVGVDFVEQWWETSNEIKSELKVGNLDHLLLPWMVCVCACECGCVDERLNGWKMLDGWMDENGGKHFSLMTVGWMLGIMVMLVFGDAGGIKQKPTNILKPLSVFMFVCVFYCYP